MFRLVRFTLMSGVALLATLAACDGGTTGPTGPGPAASVTIAPASASVAVGETTQLVATARDAGGATVSASFTWSSSSANATVDGSGLVTGVSEGTATITATTAGINGTAAIAVTPPPVASVEVDPTTGSLTVGETLQLTATPKDAAGNALSATVTWSSSDDAVASVDATGLVTAQAGGQATITATANGQSGTASVAVAAGPFSPTGDTSLSGTMAFADVTIPAGVTVTATDDLDLSSVGDVNIAGTLAGECVAIALRGGANVTVTGTISNACTQGQDDGPALVIEGDGDLSLTGGMIESGGEVTVRNDPTLDDTAFPSSALPVAASAAGARAGTCIASNFSFVPNPTSAANGTDGKTGTDGKDGKTWRLLCRGDATLAGGVRVFGQDGGHGGRGMDTSNTGASALGGNGGKGGLIRLLATGTWTFSGSGNEAIGGDGGIGGFTEATGTFNADLEPKAAGADAQSGNGGDAGLVEVRSLSSITVNGNALTITVGDGGHAGDVKATGARGAHADERNNKAAQAGGEAVAIAGDGGGSPDKEFMATGTVTGAPTVAGGNAGNGGDAMAESGIGGDGNQAFKDGAVGGAIDDAANGLPGALGGDGGDAEIKDGGGNLIGIGGMGGSATVTGGDGGWGFDGCSVSPVEDGGNGAAGGKVTVADGTGGTGLGGRAASKGVTVTGLIGNGGWGGDGEPTPGTGAPAGANTIQSTGPLTETGTRFTDGLDGVDCHSGTYNVTVTIKTDPAGHAPFIGLGQAIVLDIVLKNFSEQGSDFDVFGTAPFVGLSGTRDAQGNMTGSGVGTVAGFPNVTVTWTGTLTCDGTLTIDYSMGAGGELPQGQPIVYTLSGSRNSSGSSRAEQRPELRGARDGTGAVGGGCG